MNNNKGFSIIEVMIAMVIFGITLMAATTMLLMTIKLNTTGNMQTIAKNYTIRLMEEIRSQEAFSMERGEFYDLPHPAFTREWDIVDTGNPAVVRVNITTSWKRFGKNKRFSITTLHKGLFVGGSSWIPGSGNFEDVY